MKSNANPPPLPGAGRRYLRAVSGGGDRATRCQATLTGNARMGNERCPGLRAHRGVVLHPTSGKRNPPDHAGHRVGEQEVPVRIEQEVAGPGELDLIGCPFRQGALLLVPSRLPAASHDRGLPVAREPEHHVVEGVRGVQRTIRVNRDILRLGK